MLLSKKSLEMHALFKARAKSEDGCFNCGADIETYYHQKKNKQYICRLCTFNISPLTTTPLSKSHIALKTWFSLLDDILSSTEGVDIRTVENKYNLSNTSAWNIMYKIRDWINQVEQKENLHLTKFTKINQGLRMVFVLQYSHVLPASQMLDKMLAILPPLFTHIRNRKSIN